MAKKSLNVGSILKGKEGKGDYLAVRKNYTLLVKDDKGQVHTLGRFLNLDNRKTLLESAARLEEQGRDQIAAGLRQRAEGLPEFVRFEVRGTVEE